MLRSATLAIVVSSTSMKVTIEMTIATIHGLWPRAAEGLALPAAAAASLTSPSHTARLTCQGRAR
jgi:hypothetical protein